jgi:predicted nuclease of restriction endonuclease-like (RecB) superfamily
MPKQNTIQLFKSIRLLVEQSRRQLYSIANTALTETYFHIGRLIVEYEQYGKARAVYSKETLKLLSAKLTTSLGKGFSVDNLENMRNFYNTYKDDYIRHISKNQKSEPVARKLFSSQKSETVSRKSNPAQKSEPLARKLELSPFKLSWTHYVFLLKIEHPHERKFYEIEAVNENWSKRELQRNYDSALFERLALSRNKEKVKQLSRKGHIIQQPADAIKDPYILEFLNFAEKDAYSESDLEEAIINKLEQFLKELGKGFLFVDRQKRLRMDGDDYKIDLVFYHRILRCFVLIDLKIGTLQHKDIGQMQMYVNYYDEHMKSEDEIKTIGIILCRNKKESLIRYTLGKDGKQIFASRYKMYFPEKQMLRLIKSYKY